MSTNPYVWLLIPLGALLAVILGGVTALLDALAPLLFRTVPA